MWGKEEETVLFFSRSHDILTFKTMGMYYYVLLGT